MEMQFEDCIIDDEKISFVSTFVCHFKDITKIRGSNSYETGKAISNEFISLVAKKLAEEYMEKNKMELLNSISKEDIVNGIQLKMIENFNTNR